jgi:hypothetical protein
MSPLFWGFAGWFFIHAIALGYPNDPTDDHKRVYSAFFGLIPSILPCPICGKHFSENMAKNPIRLGSKMELFAWTVEMHNFVNESKGRKKLTVEEAYEEFRKNGEAFKDKSLFKHGISLESLVINDPKVDDVVRQGIEQGIQQYISKYGPASNTNNNIMKITIIALISYIIYLHFIKK